MTVSRSCACLQHNYSFRSQRSRSECGRKYTRGQKLQLVEPVILNHKRIALSRFVVARQIQPASPLPSFLVLPFVNTGLPQPEILELRIRIPNDSRCLFVRGDQHRRIIYSLLDRNTETTLLCLGAAFSQPYGLPRPPGCAPILDCIE